MYDVHRLCPPRRFRRNARKKEKKAVFNAIAHKNMLFLIFLENDLDRTEVLLLLAG